MNYYPQSTYLLYKYWVPRCMFHRRNWDSSTPSPASECAAPPPPPRNQRRRGGGTLTCGWGGGGVPIPTTGKKLSTLPTLWYYLRIPSCHSWFSASFFSSSCACCTPRTTTLQKQIHLYMMTLKSININQLSMISEWINLPQPKRINQT